MKCHISQWLIYKIIKTKGKEKVMKKLKVKDKKTKVEGGTKGRTDREVARVEMPIYMAPHLPRVLLPLTTKQVVHLGHYALLCLPLHAQRVTRAELSLGVL